MIIFSNNVLRDFLIMTAIKAGHNDVIPPLSEPGEPKVYEETQRRLTDEDFFDQMMKRCNSMPFQKAFEPILRQMFNASRAIIWLQKEFTYEFYTPTLNRLLIGEDTLVAAASRARTSINCISIEDVSSLEQIVSEPRTPQLFFPLYIRAGPVIAVAQVSRHPDEIPFGEREMAQARFVTRKYAIYGTCTLTGPRTISLASDLAKISDPADTIARMDTALTNNFNCESIEYWFYKPEPNIFGKFDREKSSFVSQPPNQAGVVSHALRAKIFINERAAKFHVNFNAEADGDPKKPILVGYCEFNKLTWAVALRGRTVEDPFSIDDEKRLKIVMTFIARTLSFSNGFSHKPPAPTDESSLSLFHLLDSAATLSSTTNFPGLIKNIEMRAEELVGCESCRLLYVNQTTQKFHFDVGNNFDDHKVAELTEGIAGLCYSMEEVLIIDDPSTEEHFNEYTDKKEGIRELKNMMAVPIYSSIDKVIAVLLCSNKNGPTIFTLDDEDRIVAFAVFCGISLQNILIFTSSMIIMRKMQELLKIDTDAINMGSIRDLLSTILSIVQNFIFANRLTLFLIRTIDNTMFEFMTVGESPKSVQTNYAEQVKIKKDTQTYRQQNGFICCSALISSDSNVLGAFEIECPDSLPGVIDLMTSISSFAAVIIERYGIKAISTIGQQQLQLNQVITEVHAESNSIPEFFKFEELKESVIYSMNFDASLGENMEMVRVVFTIFDKFDLNKTFNIRNRTLFFFLSHVSKAYQIRPYFNWRHAIDCLQYMTYQIFNSGFTEKFTKLEIFASLIAALCHNLEHDGFSTEFNQLATKPTEILYKYQSVKEIGHLTRTIFILSREESNILAELEIPDKELVYELMIRLILATNMKDHFEILDKLSKIEFNIDEKESRWALLDIFMKASDLAPLSRPFEVANRSYQYMCEEFFHQGEITKVEGFVFTDDKKDYSHLVKEQSIIPFYKSVCIPIFEATASICPKLDINLQQVKINVDKWERRQMQNMDGHSNYPYSSELTETKIELALTARSESNTARLDVSTSRNVSDESIDSTNFSSREPFIERVPLLKPKKIEIPLKIPNSNNENVNTNQEILEPQVYHEEVKHESTVLDANTMDAPLDPASQEALRGLKQGVVKVSFS